MSGFFASVCEGDPFVLFFWSVEWEVSFGDVVCVRGNREEVVEQDTVDDFPLKH